MIKGLEALEKIKKLDILYDIEMTEKGEEYFKEHSIDLSIIEKELKALEIIKEKKVNTAEFIAYVKDTNHNYETYLLDYSQEHWYLHINDNNETSYCLIQEEYELIKEVLL